MTHALPGFTHRLSIAMMSRFGIHHSKQQGFNKLDIE